MPREGSRALIRHFGGQHERATVIGVLDDGRRLVVTGEDGERLEFTLRQGTATFVQEGERHGPRLQLEE